MRSDVSLETRNTNTSMYINEILLLKDVEQSTKAYSANQIRVLVSISLAYKVVEAAMNCQLQPLFSESNLSSTYRSALTHAYSLILMELHGRC